MKSETHVQTRARLLGIVLLFASYGLRDRRRLPRVVGRWNHCCLAYTGVDARSQTPLKIRRDQEIREVRGQAELDQRRNPTQLRCTIDACQGTNRDRRSTAKPIILSDNHRSWFTGVCPSGSGDANIASLHVEDSASSSQSAVMTSTNA